MLEVLTTLWKNPSEVRLGNTNPRSPLQIFSYNRAAGFPGHSQSSGKSPEHYVGQCFILNRQKGYTLTSGGKSDPADVIVASVTYRHTNSRLTEAGGSDRPHYHHRCRRRQPTRKRCGIHPARKCRLPAVWEPTLYVAAWFSAAAAPVPADDLTRLPGPRSSLRVTVSGRVTDLVTARARPSQLSLRLGVTLTSGQ